MFRTKPECSTPNARINRARTQPHYGQVLRMKAMLFALRLNELLCCSSCARRAERLLVSMSRVIADDHCHALASRDDSTCITLQPASRIIPSTLHQHNRGAAGDSFDFTRSGDITPELTRREVLGEASDLANDIRAISARVE